MSCRYNLLLLAFLLLPTAAAAIPLSISRSSQQQVGWSNANRVMLRLTGLQTLGTSGENIRPSDGRSTFKIYSTPFAPDRNEQSFDYSSTNNDSTTQTDSTTATFSVYATQSTSFEANSPAPLGFFGSGNSAFRGTR